MLVQSLSWVRSGFSHRARWRGAGARYHGHHESVRSAALYNLPREVTGCAGDRLHIPIQAPPEPIHLERCRHVVGGSAAANRTVLCAMASKMDESVGKLVDDLMKYDQWDNTLIWAISDNGGTTMRIFYVIVLLDQLWWCANSDCVLSCSIELLSAACNSTILSCCKDF